MRLLREYKGPTVEGLLSLSDHALSQLPEDLGTVLRAIEGGSLETASGSLDDVMARMTPGRHDE